MSEQEKTGWIAIKYVGGKKREVDHNYGSGVIWTGKGDTQLVPPESAVKLLKHPEFEDARHNFQKGKPIAVPAVVAKVETEEEQLEHPLIKLEASTKAEIELYAKRNFGIDIDRRHTKDDLIVQVRNMMNRSAKP